MQTQNGNHAKPGPFDDRTGSPGHAITFDFYNIHDLTRLVRERPRLTLAPEVREKIRRGAEYVTTIARQDRYIYGVNTGFGCLCETRVSPDDMSALQTKHLMSHACGVGPYVDEDLCRLVLFVKLLTFRHGHSGITERVVDRLLRFWNDDVIPAIPKKGSVGASGDLAPLAHMGLPVIGLGEVYHRQTIRPAGEVLLELGWEPVQLAPKEGLALTNGVQYINARGAYELERVGRLLKAADLISALSMQGFSVANTFFQKVLHETSYHPERGVVAGNLRTVLDGSNHHRLEQCNKACEDPYSFRCVPQVHAAVRQTYHFARTLIERECNSVSDNPLFFPEQDQVLCGGSLHGESTAFAFDFMAIALSELANISERRTYQLLTGQHGLPDFLVPKPGLDSGLMIVQYTSAALLNENKVLCTPSSIDTIPTCQYQEDHVSMGPTGAYKLNQIVENTEYILGIELLTAFQAIDLNRGLKLSPWAEEIRRRYRAVVPFIGTDRVMRPEIEASRRFLLAELNAWSERLE
jgi:histidine ammonia-lyase